MRLKGDLIRCSEKRPFLYPCFSVAIVKVWTESKKRGSGYTYTGTFWLCEDVTVMLSLFPRLHKQQRTKSMQRLISSLWGTDTVTFQVTSPLRVVLGNASIVGRALDGTLRFRRWKRSRALFEEMSSISGYLPSNAR